MTAVSKWVAAGSSAAVLAGGLFIGAPAASAAPGDAVCLQASTQFEAALGAAGLTEESVARLEAAAEAAAAAESTYFDLLEAAEAGPLAELELAEADLEDATAATAEAEAALVAAQGSGDADAIAAAEAARDAAVLAETEAGQAVEDLIAAYEAAISTPEILAAEEAYDAAAAEFEAALGMLSLDEESAASLMALFEAFLAACNPEATGIDTPAAVPAAAPLTNKGLNVQTAVEAETAAHPGLALLAGLLAAGIAVPTAVALRMRRLESARK